MSTAEHSTEEARKPLKQVSIKKVAELAGVSIATVSRCLNDPQRVKERTRIKVQEAILKTGYAPNTLAQSFRRGRTNMIMVVLPSIGDPFFTEVVKGIRSVVNARGYSIIINETQFNTLTAEELGTMLVSRQSDGVILLASIFPFGNEVLARASQRSQPIVIGCETISAALADFPSVHIDNVAAAQEATDFLVSRGHERIAFISGEKTSLLTKDREFGYRSAMHRANLPIEDGWVVDGGLSIPGAVKATRQLLNQPNRPTAIFCANDEMAIGCLHEIQNEGLHVPGDISVMGFDDIRYAETTNPPLTTIAQPTEEIGERVAYRMLKAIETANGVPDEPEIVPHKLIVRQSVGSPS